MAKLTQQPTVKLEVTLTLTEEEAHALDAIVGYGADAFLKCFYQLGKAYLEPHEAGVRSLFKSVREILPTLLSRAEEARKVFGYK